MTVINQSGVSSPFSFAVTGDEYVVAGVITNLGGAGVSVISSAQAGNKITNAGQISSLGTGDAITLLGGGTVSNAGVISGAITTTSTMTFTNAAAGRFAGFVVSSQDALSPGSVITNRGTMVFNDALGGSAHVAGAVIGLGASNDTVVNSGKIVGDILLGGGNDIFDGRGGSVLGTVNGGLGDDLYYLSQATTIVDGGGLDSVNARFSATLASGIENLTLGGFGNFYGTGNSLANVMTGNGSNNGLDGQGGNDTLLGGVGNDTLLGGTNNDSLDGQTGNDAVSGGYGNDIAAGGDGNDRVNGDTGTDALSGGTGLDTLDGGIGADTMDGGDDADLMIGGAFGTDVMMGGLGADTFRFLTASDSFATLAADVITDFVAGVDKIDLSALTDTPLAFMGSALLSMSVASVRVTAGSGGTTVISVDLNHDRTADMQIILTGALALTVTDFLL